MFNYSVINFDRVGTVPRIILLISVSTFGGLLLGYGTGIIAGALDPLQETGSFSSIHRELFAFLINLFLLIGCMIGAISAGYLADFFGRRLAILLIAILGILGTLGCIVSPGEGLVFVVVGLSFFCLFRFLLGLAIGMSTVLCPLYVSEAAPKRIRGTLGTMFQLAITFGIFLAYVSGAILQDVPWNWRWMIGLGVLPSFMLLIVSLIMPESPPWLEQYNLKRQQNSESDVIDTADSSLELTRESDQSHLITQQVNGIETTSPTTSKSKSGQWIQIFTNPRVSFRPMFLGLVLCTAMQLTGINGIIYFAPSIFRNSGISNPYIPTVGLGFFNFLMTFPAIPLVDISGRRLLILTGIAIVTIADTTAGFVFQFLPEPWGGYLGVVCIIVFIFGFSAGMGPIFFVIVSELFPDSIKEAGMSIINMTNWFFNMLVAIGFLYAVHLLGQPVVFWIFGGIGVVCFIILLLFLPETKPKKEKSKPLMSEVAHEDENKSEPAQQMESSSVAMSIPEQYQE